MPNDNATQSGLRPMGPPLLVYREETDVNHGEVAAEKIEGYGPIPSWTISAVEVSR